MIGTPPQPAVPMHVWAKTLLLFILLFWEVYALITIRDRWVARDSFEYFGSPEMDSSQVRSPDWYFVGTSLSRYALQRFHSLEKAIANAGDRSTYRIVVRTAGGLEDYPVITDEIMAAHPRAIFVEATMACIDRVDRTVNPVSRFLAQFSLRLVAIPKRVIEMKGGALDLLTTTYQPMGTTPPFQWSGDWDQFARSAVHYRVRELDEFEDWASFFRKARTAGIRVYLLDIPRSRQADSCLSGDFHRSFSGLTRDLEREYGVKYLEFPEKLDQAPYYFDHAHFNQAGGERYAAWLVRTLQQRELTGGAQ